MNFEDATVSQLKHEVYRLRDGLIALPKVGDKYKITRANYYGGDSVWRVFPTRVPEVVAFYNRNGEYWSVPISDWKDAVWKGEVEQVIPPKPL